MLNTDRTKEQYSHYFSISETSDFSPINNKFYTFVEYVPSLFPHIRSIIYNIYV